MQAHHRRFFDSIPFDGYHGNDANGVDGEARDVDEMLDRLATATEERLEEYEDRQHFTKPSKERREARQRAEHRLQQIEDAPPVSGTHG